MVLIRLQKIPKRQQINTKITSIFKSKKHQTFTEEIKKIALSSKDVKKMQSTDSTEKYAWNNVNV